MCSGIKYLGIVPLVQIKMIFEKKKPSIARQLAVRFSLVLSVVILAVALLLTLLLRYNVRLRQNNELVYSMEHLADIEQRIHDFRMNLPPAVDQIKTPEGVRRLPPRLGSDLPYYITFTIFNDTTHTVYETNDPFLPLLPVSYGHPKRYTRKNYYIDGDLNILYCSDVFKSSKEEPFVVQVALTMDRDTAEQLLERAVPVFLVILIPLLFISYVAAYSISKSTMIPVRNMTIAARHIGSENLDRRLPTTGHGDELDELAQTFNDLFTRLKTDFDRERQFTSDVSHELRTPLAVILGHANLIRRWGKDDPVQLQKSLDMLISEVHTMESIVENLLQLSRLENGKWNSVIQEVSVQELCYRLRDDTLAWAPDVQFDVVMDDDFRIYTDQELLYQACTIIVSNSIKFGGKSVCIKVHIQQVAMSADKDGLEFRFMDSGPGITPDVLPHIFERFYRGDSAHNRSAGGSGLGLAIVKSICMVLGGTVRAESNETGAVFVLTLPI